MKAKWLCIQFPIYLILIFNVCGLCIVIHLLHGQMWHLLFMGTVLHFLQSWLASFTNKQKAVSFELFKIYIYIYIGVGTRFYWVWKTYIVGCRQKERTGLGVLTNSSLLCIKKFVLIIICQLFCAWFQIEDQPDVLDRKCQELAQMLQSAKNAIVYTGAGISTVSYMFCSSVFFPSCCLFIKKKKLLKKEKVTFLLFTVL